MSLSYINILMVVVIFKNACRGLTQKGITRRKTTPNTTIYTVSLWSVWVFEATVTKSDLYINLGHIHSSIIMYEHRDTTWMLSNEIRGNSSASVKGI